MLGQSGSNVEVVAFGEEVIKDQVVNLFGLRIDAHSWIEICRAGFNDHHQRVGVRLAGTGKKREEQCNEQCRKDRSGEKPSLPSCTFVSFVVSDVEIERPAGKVRRSTHRRSFPIWPLAWRR